MVIIGIDPGTQGAVAICSIGGTIEVHRMTTLKSKEGELNPALLERIIKIKHDSSIILAYVERVHGMPNWGYHNFNFGKFYGIILGLLWGLRISVVSVPPITWQAGIHGCKKREKRDKTLSGKEQRRLTNKKYKAKKVKNCQVAANLFPRLAYLLKTKNSDGIADALLIMEYGRREMGLKPTEGIQTDAPDVSQNGIFR